MNERDYYKEQNDLIHTIEAQIETLKKDKREINRQKLSENEICFWIGILLMSECLCLFAIIPAIAISAKLGLVVLLFTQFTLGRACLLPFYGNYQLRKTEKRIDREIAFKKTQLEKEKANLKCLIKREKSTEFRSVKVDDRKPLKNLNGLSDHSYDLGSNVLETFEEKGPSLVLKKKNYRL